MSMQAAPRRGDQWQTGHDGHGHKGTTGMVVAGQLAGKQPMLLAAEYVVLMLCTLGAIGVLLLH